MEEILEQEDTMDPIEDSALEDYFEYIECLSREDLITLLKWEVHNRVFHMRSLENRCQKIRK